MKTGHFVPESVMQSTGFRVNTICTVCYSYISDHYILFNSALQHRNGEGEKPTRECQVILLCYL